MEWCSTYLFLLLVEVVNDDTNEKVQGEEGPEDDENDKVDIHVEVVLPLGLLFILGEKSDREIRQAEASGLDRQGSAQGHPVGEAVSRGSHQHGCVVVSVTAGRGQGEVGQRRSRWWEQACWTGRVLCWYATSTPGPLTRWRTGARLVFTELSV